MESKPTHKKPSLWARLSRRTKIVLFSLIALIVLGIALGVGLGLGLNQGGSDDNNEPPSFSGTPLPTPSSRPAWTPKPGDSWQIMLLNPPVMPVTSGVASSTPTAKANARARRQAGASPVPLTPDVSIYDIDLFDSSAQLISALHALNKRVLCYFSGGSYEPNRPDSHEFQPADMGRELDGWPGEKWLDLGSENVRRIMKARIELAHQKGCDAVDVDNVDGYNNKNGLGPKLSPNASISFLLYLSTLTLPLNLSLGLKNAGEIIPSVLPIVDFSVNEQCAEYNECSTFSAFIDAGKPVFHIEYPKKAGQVLAKGDTERYCNAKGAEGFSTVLKRMDLDGWVQFCDGVVESTVGNGTVHQS